MELPSQVQRQLDAAAAIEASLLNSGLPDTPAPANPTESPPPEPVEPAPTEVAPAPAPAPEPSQTDARYKVLQGKYDAEVPRLHKEAQALRERVEAQDAELKALSQKIQRPAVESKPLVTSKDVEEYGPEMYDFIGRVAEKVFSEKFLPIIGRMQSEFEARVLATESTVGNVAVRQQQTEEEKFWLRLLDAVPNWQAINETPEWLLWLAEHDRMIGSTRQAVLDQAVATLNSDRIIAVFEQYIEKHKKPEPTVQKTVSLASQVSPSSATATSVPVPQAQGNIWTDAGIQEFYKDVSLGKFRGREEEQARIEADLDAAYSEGRYRPR